MPIKPPAELNEKGQEIIVDDGECLKKTTKRKPGTVVLGKLTKSSKFSLKGFLNFFGHLRP